MINKSPLEIAQIFGEPRDPRKSYTNLVNAICETDVASPDEFHYYFDALLEDDKVIITNTGNGIITQENISPDTPATLDFVDMASPEYYMYIKDLANAKEKTVARKLKTISRAMNEWEDYKVILMLATATGTSNNQTFLESSQTTFNFEHLINMINQVKDYGDSYVLIVSGTIDKDILLWDWNDNKYQSLKQAREDLNIDIIRIGTPHKVTVDGASKQILPATKAYLVARDAEAGKPLLFVRKQLNEIELLGGIINEQTAPDARPQRLVFAGGNPINVGSDRKLAVAITGYEQVALAVTNMYSVAEFTRGT